MASIELMLLHFILTIMTTCAYESSICQTLTWNTSSESYLQFHVRYCGRFCDENGKLQIEHREFCLEPECFPCDCESDCFIYDSFCPRMINSVITEPKAMLNPGLPDASRFVCSKLSNNLNSEEKEILFISDCDLNFLNNLLEDSNTLLEYLSRCQNSSTTTLDDITPYSDMYYGIVFKNKFCALCNGYTINSNMTSYAINSSVKVASPWSIEVSCQHFQQLYHLTSELDLLIAASRLGYCKISRSPPKSYLGLRLKSCLVDVGPTAPKKCRKSDTVLKKYCRKTARRFLGIRQYGNIFCYLCSQAVSFYKCLCPSYSMIVPAIIDFKPPITFLLDVSDRHPTDYQKCSMKNSWLDFQGECHTADCSSGKLATKEGDCSTPLSRIRGLGYKLTLTLVPVDIVKIAMKKINLFHDAIHKKMCLYSDNDRVLLKTNLITSSDGLYSLYSATIRAYIVADKESPRDEVERKFLELVSTPWDIKPINNIGVVLKPLMLGTETVDLINSSLYVNSTREFSWELYYLPEMFTYKHVYNPYDNTRVLTSIWLLKDDFIDITYSLLCPFVSVNISEVINYYNGVKFIFLFGGREIGVMAGPNISVVKGTLHICLDTFKALIKEDVTTSLPIIILYYFQVVCFLLSIVCLVISLVTYTLFRALRSLPGLNNMGLCVSLATAQICLLVTVEYGVKGFLSYGFCMFLAILLHYSWLASFSWMSACCIHMYVAFTSCKAPSPSASSARRRFMRYCFYAFGAPAVIVTLTLILSIGTTSGASYGYDTTVCFIDNRKSVLTLILSLLVPLGTLVISNGVLFVLTLLEMVHTVRIQKATTNVERQGVMTYVKLSTLTGIFCIISAMAVWLDSIVLQFLTCPVMALQGVFIFFSFIFTRRVYKLFFDLLDLQRLGFTLAAQGVSSTTTGTQDTKKRETFSFNSVLTDSTTL